MSHDRGCSCGREKYEYQDCTDLTCWKKPNQSSAKKLTKTTYTLDGYVIVPPVAAWDDKKSVIPQMSYRTFGMTAIEAWRRHINGHNEPDESRMIQKWHDFGYRLKKASITIVDEQ